MPLIIEHNYGIREFTKNVVPFKYSDFANNVSYTFSGLYDITPLSGYVALYNTE